MGVVHIFPSLLSILVSLKKIFVLIVLKNVKNMFGHKINDRRKLNNVMYFLDKLI